MWKKSIVGIMFLKRPFCYLALIPNRKAVISNEYFEITRYLFSPDVNGNPLPMFHRKRLERTAGIASKRKRTFLLQEKYKWLYF